MITFRVPSGELAALLQSITRVIPKTDPNRLRGEILFETNGEYLYLTGSNPQFRISGEIKLPSPCEMCKFTVPPADITDYVKDLPEQPLTFTYEPDEENGRGPLNMSFAGGEIRFTATNGENYPSFERLDGEDSFSFNIDTHLIRQGINRAIDSATQEADHKNLSCICFQFRNDYLDMVGTDGLILSKFRINQSFIPGMSPSEKKGFLLPYNCANFMKTFLPPYDKEEMFIKVSQKSILFKIASLEIESLLLDATYPNYESIIPPKFEYVLSMNTTQFRAVINRMQKFLKDDTFVDIYPGDNEMRIEAKKIEENKVAKETIPFENANEFKTPISFDKKRLLKLLDNIDSDQVLFNIVDHTRSIIIAPSTNEENTELISLIMPAMVR